MSTLATINCMSLQDMFAQDLQNIAEAARIAFRASSDCLVGRSLAELGNDGELAV